MNTQQVDTLFDHRLIYPSMLQPQQAGPVAHHLYRQCDNTPMDIVKACTYGIVLASILIE